MSEKWGLSHRNPEKSGHSYTFCWKKGANHIPGSAEKGAIRHAHPYYAIYRKLPPPPPPPPPSLKFTSMQTTLRYTWPLIVQTTQLSPNDSANLQKDFDLLQEWEAQWDMGFNPGKCQVLHITRARNSIKSIYTKHKDSWKCFLCQIDTLVSTCPPTKLQHHINI